MFFHAIDHIAQCDNIVSQVIKLMSIDTQLNPLRRIGIILPTPTCTSINGMTTIKGSMHIGVGKRPRTQHRRRR